jgi:hypothetical protein
VPNMTVPQIRGGGFKCEVQQAGDNNRQH